MISSRSDRNGGSKRADGSGLAATQGAVCRAIKAGAESVEASTWDADVTGAGTSVDPLAAKEASGISGSIELDNDRNAWVAVTLCTKASVCSTKRSRSFFHDVMTRPQGSDISLEPQDDVNEIARSSVDKVRGLLAAQQPCRLARS